MKSKESDYIDICGKEIYYEIISPEILRSDSPMIIFLHEGLGCIKKWKDFPEVIGEETECRILIYDRYGYGKSEKFSEPRTSNYLNKEAFEFLPELLEKLHVNEKVILIGHSDGGSIALLYASKYSSRILGLITEADHLYCEEFTIAGIRDTIKDYEEGNLRSALRKFHGDKTDAVFYGWSHVWIAEENKNWNIESFLPLITCPVLAIQGKNDAYGTEKQLLSKKKLITGNVEIMYIDNCGHIPHFEATNDVKTKMVAFITKCMNSYYNTHL